MTWYRVALPCVSFFGELSLFDTADKVLAEIGDATELELFVDSVGGNSGAALQIFKALRGRTKVATVRRAYSSAVLLPMAADKILIERSGRMMIHPLRQTCFCDQTGLLAEAENLASITEEFVGVISQRSGTKPKLVRKWLRGSDRYFSAEQCIAFGLADEIIDAPAPLDQKPAAIIDTELAGIADDGKAALLLDLLGAIGTIKTADRATLMEAVRRWAIYNIQQSL